MFFFPTKNFLERSFQTETSTGWFFLSSAAFFKMSTDNLKFVMKESKQRLARELT